MKKIVLLLLAVSLLSSGCGTTQPQRTGAIMGGATIGNSVGGAIGGLIGDSRPRTRENNNPQREPQNQPVEQVAPSYDFQSSLSSLQIHNLRFIDENRNHILNAGENSKIIFEIMNEGSEIAYNVIPSVTEISGAKQIHISPSILVEQILPGNGVKYTATVSVGKRVKNGTATFRVAVTDTRGQIYDRQEFTLNTSR